MTLEERITAIETELQHLRNMEKLRAVNLDLIGTRQDQASAQAAQTAKALPKLEAAMRQLEETAIVIGHLQNRQGDVLKGHAEWLQAHDRAMKEARERGDETDRRIEKLVSAIGQLISEKK